jgi:hypothetical protein
MLAFLGLSCSNGRANKALMPVKKSAKFVQDIPAGCGAREKRDCGDADFAGDLK